MAIQLPYPNPDPITGRFDDLAMYRNLQYLASVITKIQTGETVPTGAILLVASGSACPSGYTKVATGNGSYVRISTGSAGGTGGSLNVSVTDGGHTHAVDPASTASGAPSATVEVQAGTGTTVATDTHTHDTDIASFSSGSATTGISGTIAPTYVDFIL